MDENIRKLLDDAARDAGASTVITSPAIKDMADHLIAKGVEEHEVCFIVNAATLLHDGAEELLETLDHITTSHGSLSAATAMAAVQHLLLDAYLFLHKKCEQYKEAWPFDPRYIDFAAIRQNTERADEILKHLVRTLGTKETMR